MIPTCSVTCTVHDQSGNPDAGARVRARLNNFEVYNGYVVPALVSGTADENGECVLELWPNELGSTESLYEITILGTNGRRLSTTASVPDASSADLYVIAELPPYDGKSEGQIAVEEAAQSATAAAISETNAANSASAASTSETNAANSASAASTSETNAANSASAAQTAETGAETARDEAQDLVELSFNQQTTNYTLTISDAGGVVDMDLISSGTLTVPADAAVAFPVGTQIAVVQVGAGKATITPAAGVTVNTSAYGLTTDGQWATAMLIKRGTDEWVAAGALSDAS